MRLFFGLAVLLPILASELCQAATSDYNVVVFSAAGARSRTKTEVSVAAIFGAPGSHEYAFRKTEAQFSKQLGRPKWTDTIACPQARGVLEALSRLPMPKPLVLGLRPSADLIITADGGAYTVKTSAAYQDPTDDAVRVDGDIELSTNIGTPLADWVGQSLRALAPCWKDKLLNG